MIEIVDEGKGNMETGMEANIAILGGKEVRRTLHKGEWWFSIVDVCEVMAGSTDAGAYWRKLKQSLKEEGCEVVTLCHGLKRICQLVTAAKYCEQVILRQTPDTRHLGHLDKDVDVRS